MQCLKITLKDNKICTCFDGIKLVLHKVLFDVLQGSGLRPILFLWYENDAPIVFNFKITLIANNKIFIQVTQIFRDFNC